MSPFDLLLSSEPDNLEELPLEELRYIHECERQRLGLTRTVGVLGGITAAVAAGKLIRK
ncbi:MAG: hypothetical protein H0W68_00760 [Gemmatimonadaceae bacterium]|nr:hypothetical protein [Gemmatimonadaceae bacterium]